VEPGSKRLVLLRYMEPASSVAWLASRLAEAFPGHLVEQAGEARLPPQFFDVTRGQWMSSQVLGYAALLREQLGADALLLVVGGDGYVPGLNFVFGHALLGGGVGVVYTERLRPEFYGERRNEGLYLERLLKESLHELGHGFGLEHCSNPRCVMSFSNSIADVDGKEAKFCSRCAALLEAAGVAVSPRYVLG